ncbi:tRNA-splicing endonuclease subunit Sen34 [Mycena sanguinolenta]|uniref:tRNA-splicing endonuclease subunit Sen34 n=1 Tax=Mycena sanguinolenta TaxID=230812 RepID=A0A8H6YLC8_9AGAR|nr:tRNA-splicing endonuclease subunit Sen34 [Mycena sanguinolenta]
MASTEASVPRLHLRVANKKAYVWDVEDIATIRTKHRLCGVFTGTLPHMSQQNLFLGVPMVLLPEEVVLLVENELAVLVDDPNAHIQPSVPELQRWNAKEKELAQLRLAQLNAAIASLPAVLSEEAMQKRKERELKRQAAAAKAAEAAAEGSIFAPPENAPPPPPPPEPQYTVVIPASSISFEWYNDSACHYTTIQSAKEAGIWEYPSNLHERAKCGVFRGLWEQGMYMGGGIKFGGDYLVYPGDPLRYHAHFSATVLESPTFSLTPMEIVAHGRLGTVTKKSHLLCGWDDEKKEVSYLSIEWAGFG